MNNSRTFSIPVTMRTVTKHGLPEKQEENQINTTSEPMDVSNGNETLNVSNGNTAVVTNEKNRFANVIVMLRLR